MTTPSVDDQKAVVYYGAAVTAWFSNALEYDKSLLTLSGAGIGLHLTLLTTVGLRSAEGLVLYICAILCFAFSLLIILGVFRLNQKHIEDIVRSGIVGADPLLAKLDFIAIISFGAGVALTAIVGIGAAFNSYSDREKLMAEKQQSGHTAHAFDSVNGAARLQSTSSAERSVNGAASLQPPASQPKTPAQTVPPQAPPPVTKVQESVQSTSLSSAK